MSRKALYMAAAALVVLSVPAAVRALSRENSGALNCPDGANPICALYQVCRPILDDYPEAEITEQGKDCTLTVESRQIIIRRKRTEGETGYFFYTHRLPPGKDLARP